MIVGVGVDPDVSLARKAGLELGDNGGDRRRRTLRTATEGVYAAGDIAEYVSVVNGGRRQRVEHWDVAFSQGGRSRATCSAQDVEHDVVPYFFSDLADWAAIEYVGPAYDGTARSSAGRSRRTRSRSSTCGARRCRGRSPSGARTTCGRRAG